MKIRRQSSIAKYGQAYVTAKKQNTEDRGQKSEDRGQKSEDRQ